MQIPLYILLLFLLSFRVDGIDGERRNRLFFPDYVANNANFDVSLISSASFDSSEIVEFQIVFDQNVTLNSVEAKTTTKNIKLSHSIINRDNLSYTAYKVTLTNKMLDMQGGDYFQILWNVNSGNFETISLKVMQLTKKKDADPGRILYKKLSAISYTEEYSGVINCYKPTKKPGKAALFNRVSSLLLELNEIKASSLLIETWVKFNQSSMNFFKIVDKNNGKEILRLKLNDFNVLSFEEENPDLVLYRQNFISLKNWYHFSVLYSTETKTFYFNLNGCRFAELRNNFSFKPDDISVSFFTKKAASGFNLDALRYYALSETLNLEACFNYRDYSFPGLLLVAEINFEEKDEVDQNTTNASISSSSLQLIKSDAPIFSSAPEINIKRMTNSFLIEWTSTDNNDAVKYFIEKSVSGTNYVTLAAVSSERKRDYVYSFVDSPGPDDKIVYYRIKQLNMDGSFTYSSQVKIGQGIVETFDIKQNFPNPFNPLTKITIEMFEDSFVEVTVYSLEGKVIDVLHKGYLKKGEHYFSFDGTNLPSGVYLYTVNTPSFSQTKKMLLAK